MNTSPYLLMMLLLASPFSTAVAEAGDWYMAGSIVHTDDDSDRRLDDSVAGGQVNVGRKLTETFSLEGILGHSDIDGWPSWPTVTRKESQEHLDLGLNLLSHLNPGGRFSPYFLAGGGYLGTETSSGSEENRPSASAGFGFIWHLGQSAFSIRGEFRARFALERNNNLTDRIATLGVQYSFARKRTAAPAVIDTDDDGVPNGADRCLHTEPGVVVDEFGCEVFIDSDDDGVMDRKDLCSKTPADAPVDQYGCISDYDHDGVTDDIDECPNTVSGAAIYVNGCERDDDGDGVLNHRDNCPNTVPNVPVDSDGCEIMDTIELRGVNFASNSDRLLNGAEQVLDDTIKWLMKQPHLIVEVAGHTDSDGSEMANLGLSERRAHTVRDYLINGGVHPDSLTARGYGESEPVSDNGSGEGKADNRRVELRILKDQ